MTTYNEAFFNAYVECALWSSGDLTDENGDDLENLDGYDVSPETLATMREECEAFISEDIETGYLDAQSAEQSGHDFWLTRCGHGAGFWDHGLGEIGEELSKRSKVWGSVDLYVGDDGLVYQ